MAPVNSDSSHLRQRGRCVGQPKGHLHGTVQLDGGGQFGAGLGAAFALGAQHPEAEVAVGHERPHPQLLGQGEGLALVISGLIALWRLAPRSELAEETQGPSLMRAVCSYVVHLRKSHLPSCYTAVATAEHCRRAVTMHHVRIDTTGGNDRLSIEFSERPMAR
jgi:hypothetical protein